MSAPAPQVDELDTSTPPPAPARGWWRRSWLALGVIILVIPALVFVVVGLPLRSQLGAIRTPQSALAGETIDAGGYTWTLTASKEFVGEGVDANDIPLGTSLVAAIIEITPVDDAAELEASCDTSLTSRVLPSDGPLGSRLREVSWTPISSLSQYNYRIRDDSQSYCSFVTGEKFQLEVVFLTPTGAYDDATVDITLTDEPQTFVRFELEH